MTKNRVTLAYVDKTTTGKKVRLADFAQGYLDERVRHGDVPQANSRGQGDGGSGPDAAGKAQREATPVYEKRVEHGQNSDNLDVAWASYLYAAKALEGRSAGWDSFNGRDSAEFRAGWEAAISYLYVIGGMGQ